jgi:hypothetical protein
VAGLWAFNCSVKEKGILTQYIKNQKEHHTQQAFLDEYKRILLENEVEFKEKYLL